MLDAWLWIILLGFIFLGVITGFFLFIAWGVFKVLQLMITAILGIFILLIKRLFGWD